MMSRPARATIAGATIAALVAVAAAPIAQASRAPSTRERAAIVDAIKSSNLIAEVAGRVDVRSVRVTTVRTPTVRWGTARLVPKPGVQADGATAIVGRFGRGWVLVDVGTDGAGCWLPKAVIKDLRLAGCT